MAIFDKKNFFDHFTYTPGNKMREPSPYRLEDSAGELILKIQALTQGYPKKCDEASVCERMEASAGLQYRQARARLERERDDAVFRAYHAEGGIRGNLEKLVAFVDGQLDTEEDPRTVFLIAYNSSLDMAAYQLRKLDAELSELKKHEVKIPELDEFKRSIGWKDILPEGRRMTAELKAIVAALKRSARMPKGAMPVDTAAIARQLSVISTEKDELLAEANQNFERLEQAENALKKSPEGYEAVNGELYGALAQYLSEERLRPFSREDGMTLPDYKRALTSYADEIQAALLDRWQQP